MTTPYGRVRWSTPTAPTRTFNDQVATDDGVRAASSVSDGLTIIRKREARPKPRPPDGVSSTVAELGVGRTRDVNEPRRTSDRPARTVRGRRIRSAVPLPRLVRSLRAGLRRSRSRPPMPCRRRSCGPTCDGAGCASTRIRSPGRRQTAARRAPAVVQAPGRRSAGRRTSRCRCCLPEPDSLQAILDELPVSSGRRWPCTGSRQ